MKVSTPLALAGCLAGLGVASAVALSAINSYPSPTWSGKVTVEVAGPADEGTVLLRVLGAPDGFPFEPDATITAATPGLPPGSAQQGTQLSCDLRVKDSASADAVIDVVRCTPVTAVG